MMSERQWVTTGLFALTVMMLGMAWVQPALWDVKLFEVIMQAVVLTGLLNMVAAFHFAANKQNETATENTGKMADAIKATAQAGGQGGAVVAAAQETADAARREADSIEQEQRP